MKAVGFRLGCWSCAHYRLQGCAAGRHAAWNADLGDRCSFFDYEPGSDAPDRVQDVPDRPPDRAD